MMSTPGTVATYVPGDAPAHTYMKKMWGQRNISYRIGIVCMIASSGFFFVGFVSQNWFEAKSSVKQGYSGDFVVDSIFFDDVTWGLWSGELGDDICGSACSVGLTVTRVLVCLCLLSHIVGFVVAGIENFRLVDVRSYHSRRLEVAILVTELLTGGSLVCFMYLFIGQMYGLRHVHYGWSTTVIWLSGALLFIAWIFIVCGNRKPTVGLVLTQSGQPGTILMTSQPAGTVHTAHYTAAPAQVTVIQTRGMQQPPMAQPQRYPMAQPHPSMPPPQPQYPSQAYQPLLPQQPQPYAPHNQPAPYPPPNQPAPYPSPNQAAPYPPPNQPMGAPPAYAPPPAYPMGPSAPVMGYQAVPQAEGYAKASAPPPEAVDPLPEKRRL